MVSNQAQKLVAQSKQKSDPNAPSGKKLTAAGHTVVEAIEGLLAAGTVLTVYCVYCVLCVLCTVYCVLRTVYCVLCTVYCVL